MGSITENVYIAITATDAIMLLIYVLLLGIIIKNIKAPEFSTSYFKILISLGFADVWMIFYKYYIFFIPYYLLYEEVKDSQVGWEFYNIF